MTDTISSLRAERDALKADIGRLLVAYGSRDEFDGIDEAIADALTMRRERDAARAEVEQERQRADSNFDSCERIKRKYEKAEADAAAMRQALKQIHENRCVDDGGFADPCDCGECSQCLSRDALSTTAGSALLERLKQAEKYKDEIVAEAKRAHERADDMQRKLKTVSTKWADVWVWMGDREELADHDGCTLICPLVMEADTARGIFHRMDRLLRACQSLHKWWKQEYANRCGEYGRFVAAAKERDTLRARVAELEKALADADKWIRLVAIDREARAAPHRVIFDFACSECSSDTELVKPGFRCPVHAARHRDALASTPQTQEPK